MTRDDIDDLIRRGDTAAAVTGLARFFAAAPTAGAASFLVSRFEQLATSLRLEPLRLAILRSFTIEPLVPLLRAHCYSVGIDAAVFLGDHNVIVQELLEPSSRLYEFAPDVIVIAALTRDVAPALWLGEGDLDSATDEADATVNGWMDAVRRHSAAAVIVQSFEQPAYAAEGILDVLAPIGQRRAIERLNAALASAAAARRGVHVLDYDALVARHGRVAWADAHKDLAMRVPLKAEAFGWLAEEYMRFLQPLRGRVCKAIAVDLDNTLWGGVVGEDGPAGIRIGVDYPGSAYLSLQRELKALSRRGILLAICSKNNHDEAFAILRDHPEMLLRPSDFAAMRIDWDDKASNLRAIARELNIGLDTVALLDDNPVERDWVRSQLPEVHVLDLPDDPVRYVDAIRRSPLFERLQLSEEDRTRTEQYRQQQGRTAGSAQSVDSVEAFLRSLGMLAIVDDLVPATLARAAQLTQRTNQFNVTTKRYSEEQLMRFAGQPGAIVRTVRVSDRYGDSGIVGLVIARALEERCDIDTLLLSCRVIGRQVETVILADIASQARERGARALRAIFVPTHKNQPAADVFARHGFVRTGDSAEGTIWELDLTAHTVAPPEWLEVQAAR